MQRKSVAHSWKTIGMAVLPGLYVAGIEWGGSDNGWIVAIGVLMFVWFVEHTLACHFTCDADSTAACRVSSLGLAYSICTRTDSGPSVAALASIVVIACTVRSYPLVTWIVNGVTAAELFFGLALAVVLYQWIGHQGRMPAGTIGDFFFRFDNYRWIGRSQGFVIYSHVRGPVAGGTGSGEEELAYWRTWCGHQ